MLRNVQQMQWLGFNHGSVLSQQVDGFSYEHGETDSPFFMTEEHSDQAKRVPIILSAQAELHSYTNPKPLKLIVTFFAKNTLIHYARHPSPGLRTLPH